jgi:uncharacterized protein YuzE
MRTPYLDVTFRGGKAFAAYLMLPRAPGAKAARTIEIRRNLLVDYDDEGQPIGIEILVPAEADEILVNVVLGELNLPPLPAGELRPLHAA